MTRCFKCGENLKTSMMYDKETNQACCVNCNTNDFDGDD